MTYDMSAAKAVLEMFRDREQASIDCCGQCRDASLIRWQTIIRYLNPEEFDKDRQPHDEMARLQRLLTLEENDHSRTGEQLQHARKRIEQLEKDCQTYKDGIEVLRGDIEQASRAVGQLGSKAVGIVFEVEGSPF